MLAFLDMVKPTILIWFLLLSDCHWHHRCQLHTACYRHPGGLLRCVSQCQCVFWNYCLCVCTTPCARMNVRDSLVYSVHDLLEPAGLLYMKEDYCLKMEWTCLHSLLVCISICTHHCTFQMICKAVSMFKLGRVWLFFSIYIYKGKTCLKLKMKYCENWLLFFFMSGWFGRICVDYLKKSVSVNCSVMVGFVCFNPLFFCLLLQCLPFSLQSQPPNPLPAGGHVYFLYI